MKQPDQFSNYCDGRVVWRLSAACVLLLQALIVLKHEAWLDEWQALQISLQSPSIPALFENLRYEGHPPLWYLLLRGIGHIVPAGWVLAATQLPIAWAIQALILFKLPLPRLQRLLLACNPYVLIDYGAVSRSLGLGVLLFLTAMIFRRSKAAWLAVAALPMTDFLFGILSIGCVIFAWREKRVWLPGAALWVASAICAAWSVRPASDMIPALWLNGPLHDALIELARLGTLMLPLGFHNGQLVWNELPPVPIALVGGLLFASMGCWLLRRDRYAAGIFVTFVCLIFAFSMFLYPLAIRHVSLAAVLLVVLFAMQADKGQHERLAVTAWLAVGGACGVALSTANLLEPFDTAPQVAAFMTSHHLQSRHWVVFPDSRAQGVSALTGTEFERLERNCSESFIRWNYRSHVKSVAALEKELARISDRSGSFNILTDFDVRHAGVIRAADYQLLKYVPAGFDGQNYYLYVFRPELPPVREYLPKCAPARLPLRVMPTAVAG